MIATESQPDLVRRTRCRVCDGSDLELVLSLGSTPLANAFLSSPDEFSRERVYPLDLYFCGGCSLAHLVDVVDPAILFRHYLYVTGTSTTMAAHNQEYARTLTEWLSLGPSDLVVEVASNDGSLLRRFADLGVSTLGVEPARNLAAKATESGLRVVSEFFTAALARKIRVDYQPARAVVANNVLAHVDDPIDFLAGCRALVADDGVITIEVPYVGELLDRLEYDTIYHEHLSYFSISSLLRLADRVGLAAIRIDRVKVHGGSLRVYLSPSGSGHAPDVRARAAEEAGMGIATVGRYRKFAADVARSRSELLALLHRLVGEGKRVVAYGAPAKGNTLLNYCGIDTSLIPYTVDKNPLKVGYFTPGSHLPVRDVSALLTDPLRPDYVLILAWNFADEIMHELQAHRDRGGRFILPVPHPRLV